MSGRATVTWDLFRDRSPRFAGAKPTDFSGDERVRVTFVAFTRRIILDGQIHDYPPGTPFDAYVPEGWVDHVLPHLVETPERVAQFEALRQVEARARAEHERTAKRRPDGSVPPYVGPSAERMFFEQNLSKPGTQLRKFRSAEIHRDDRKPPRLDPLADARRRDSEHHASALAEAIREVAGEFLRPSEQVPGGGNGGLPEDRRRRSAKD